MGAGDTPEFGKNRYFWSKTFLAHLNLFWPLWIHCKLCLVSFWPRVRSADVCKWGRGVKKCLQRLWGYPFGRQNPPNSIWRTPLYWRWEEAPSKHHLASCWWKAPKNSWDSFSFGANVWIEKSKELFESWSGKRSSCSDQFQTLRRMI